MTSLSDPTQGGKGVVSGKAPDISRSRFFSGLSADLHAAQASGSTTALILVELAEFRHLNRQFGFSVGDGILARVQMILESAVKKASMVVRIGDDQFAIVVPDLQSTRLLPVAAGKIQKLLFEPIEHQGRLIKLRSYVAVSAAPMHGISEDELTLHAEQSMDRAKSASDGTYVADSEDGNSVVSEWKLREELTKAIEDGELELHYQPKVCLDSFTPVASEALLRWNSPKLGQVSPEVFVSMAEKSYLINDLTEWAIMSLPRVARDMKFRDLPLNISVNLSTKDLAGGNLIATLESAMNIWGMNSENITLEITEGALMENPEHSFKVMNALKDRGFRISIDDFGTGYSSLAYFKMIPADEIKIDKCFIMNLTNDKGDQAIVKTIIAIAHHFDLKTVAEGVEDLATLQMLMRMKCDYAQGYHFTKALEASEFRKWLAEYNMRHYFTAPAAKAPAAK